MTCGMYQLEQTFFLEILSKEHRHLISASNHTCMQIMAKLKVKCITHLSTTAETPSLLLCTLLSLYSAEHYQCTLFNSLIVVTCKLLQSLAQLCNL